MSRWIFCILSLWLAQPAFAQDTAKLYQYEIQVHGVPAPGHQDHDDFEYYTKRVISFLEKSGLSTACVDIKRALTKDKLDQNIIRLLLSQPIDPASYPELETWLCAGRSSNCKLGGWGPIVEEVSGLQFYVTSYGARGIFSDMNSRPTRIVPFGMPITQFPRISKSCEDGNSFDAVLFTARTQEAHLLLKSARVEIPSTFMFGLVKADGSKWWAFGTPDPFWTNHPTTKNKVELAPKDILKDLN